MKAIEFWRSFKQNIELERTQLEDAWNESARLTEKILALNSRVIKDSKQANELIIQPEYYNIDLTEWEQKKSKTKERLYVENGLKGYRFEKYAWNFDIAVEHENDRNLWMDEVIKLAYVYCDLRVVIGYFPYDEDIDNKLKMQKEYLKAITETIKTLKCRENMKHGEYLIILGDVKSKNNKKYRKLEYTPYKYNAIKEEFELLTVEERY